MSDEKVMIGDRLQILLDKNNMDISKGSLMDKHGFNKSNLHKYITNVRRPALEDIIKLANIFNTSVDYLVGNREYILDTWAPDYLEEFANYAAEKVKEHFLEKQGIQLPENDSNYILLFALTHLLASEGKSFEDFTEEEKEVQKELIDYIIAIYYGSIRMTQQQHFHIDELKGMLGSIFNNIDGDYSFKDASIINELEKRKDKTDEEKIEILKSYIHVNMRNSQKALELLQELSERK
ncbi:MULTISPECIES: helix-turn-helix domain-containing protein [unclassified Bacillus (in: firmicutes)]|uniref:helix-turn-helix domain-containing protein n=1 Tax=unclassified Bacillus (in: firmicutes) TaxID=185979 RepID=UPI0004E195BD|nr:MULTISPECIES: helix-turn-helix transcriptional regulator [unclassified Bacillus (in: firmicutes)]